MKPHLMIFALLILSLVSVFGSEHAHEPSEHQTDYEKFGLTERSNVYFPQGFDKNIEHPRRYFNITAKRFSYTPHILHVDKGDIVSIRLSSEDVSHGFYVDGYNIETKTHPGEVGTMEFYADKAGRFTIRCSVTCGDFHPYMVGYLDVSPNNRLRFFVVLTILIAIIGAVVVFKTASPAQEKIPPATSKEIVPAESKPLIPVPQEIGKTSDTKALDALAVPQKTIKTPDKKEGTP